MKSVFNFKSFEDFLLSELMERQERNRRYSLRSFARSLGVSSSRLSEVLRGDKISIASAQKICEVLQVHGDQRTYLLDLVHLRVARSTQTRAKAEARIRTNKSLYDFVSAAPTDVWYSLALAENLNLEVPPTLESLSSKFNVSVADLKKTIEQLVTQGVLQETHVGRYRTTHRFIKVESPIPSQSIRAYHRKWLDVAKDAIEKQPIPTRKFLTSLVRLAPSQIAEARHDLEKFHAEFVKKYSQTNSTDALVYALTSQLFEATNETRVPSVN